MAIPEDLPSQNCWEFSPLELVSKQVEEDIGRSSVVGLVGVREEWIDGDYPVQWASILSLPLGTSLIHLPTLAQGPTQPISFWTGLGAIHQRRPSTSRPNLKHSIRSFPSFLSQPTRISDQLLMTHSGSNHLPMAILINHLTFPL